MLGELEVQREAQQLLCGRYRPIVNAQRTLLIEVIHGPVPIIAPVLPRCMTGDKMVSVPRERASHLECQMSLEVADLRRRQELLEDTRGSNVALVEVGERAPRGGAGRSDTFLGFDGCGGTWIHHFERAVAKLRNTGDGHARFEAMRQHFSNRVDTESQPRDAFFCNLTKVVLVELLDRFDFSRRCLRHRHSTGACPRALDLDVPVKRWDEPQHLLCLFL